MAGETGNPTRTKHHKPVGEAGNQKTRRLRAAFPVATFQNDEDPRLAFGERDTTRNGFFFFSFLLIFLGLLKS